MMACLGATKNCDEDINKLILHQPNNGEQTANMVREWKYFELQNAG